MNFNNDTSTQVISTLSVSGNSFSYINSNTLTNVLIPYISSNVIANVLTPYATTVFTNSAITTALTPYSSYSYVNGYTSNYVSSNIIVNILTPYTSYTYLTSFSSNFATYKYTSNFCSNLAPYSYTSNLTSNLISSNIIPNIIAQLVSYNYSSNFSSNLAPYSYTSNLTSNLISSNIIPNIIAQLVSYNYSSNFSSNFAPYTYTSNLSSNLISSNIIPNIIAQLVSYNYSSNFSSNFAPYRYTSNLTSNLAPYSYTSNLTSNFATYSYTSNLTSNLATYSYVNNYTSNYISSNVITNLLGFYSSTSTYPSYSYINSYSSNFLPLSGGTITGYTNFTGNLGVGTTNIVSGYKLDCRGSIFTTSLTIFDSNTLSGNNQFTLNNYQLSISPPTSTSGAAIQTIQQAIGYSQNLTLQALGGSVGIGTTNPTSLLYVNGTSSFVGISTFSNTLNGTTINASTNLQEAGTNLSVKYLTISTAGSTYFPITGGNITGNVGIGTATTSWKLDVRGSTGTQSLSVVDATSYSSQYQLLIGAPTSTTSASIQTIQQGVGYSKNLALQALGGNVGIGLTNPLQPLHTYGVSYLQAKQGGTPSTGALGTDGTAIIIYTGSSGSQSMALGFASSQLWYNVPTGNYHIFM